MIGEGHATRQIAEELHLSVKTVETYQAHIKEKLALRSARELIQHAIQWKIDERRGINRESIREREHILRQMHDLHWLSYLRLIPYPSGNPR